MVVRTTSAFCNVPIMFYVFFQIMILAFHELKRLRTKINFNLKNDYELERSVS
jgi:hypothetical protein